MNMKNTYRTLGNPSGTVSIMKAFSLLAGVLLFCLPLSAQKLTVESLEYVPNDAAAASYETQMQDINGNFAGVVKVYIALDGVQFEGGGVLKQEKRGMGEYWVWMAQGSNRLKVRAPGFLPLEVSFRAYEGVKIVKPKLTYKLVITVPKGEGVQKQKFTLRYTPADATVIIDDQVVGKNGVYEGELLVGEHSYSIAKEGYGVDKGTFSLLSSTPKRLSVELEKLQETTPTAQTTTVSTPVAQPTQPAVSNSQPQLSSENAEIIGKTPEQIRVLGYYYQSGTGGKTQDYAKALKYYLIAAERGNTTAMVLIGHMYEMGYGVAKDYSETVKWYRKAAELGDAFGQNNLAMMYDNGYGVAKDGAEAVKWLSKAAEQGNATAQYNLGAFYHSGHGVSKDLTQAKYWLEKAAAQGNEMAKNKLKELSGSDNAATPAPATGTNKTFTVKGVSFTMVYVQGGTFTMGATKEQGSDAQDYEKPAHSVTLSSYYIGETEVTQALWQAVMGTDVRQQRDKVNEEWGIRGEGSNYPMYYISWNECQEFVRRLNSMTGQQFHLPTEAQWEYAARGGSRSRGYKYSGSNAIDNVAWYEENSNKKGQSSPDYGTHPVKTKSPNELGIYDMSGNVLEWCSDYWKGSYSSGSQTNPIGPSSGSYRVFRGGSWSNNARLCRSSNRGSSIPSYRNFNLGLRLSL